jgi:hypothetical protein
MSSALRLMFMLLLPLCLVGTGCEGVFVGFVSNPIGRASVSGTVSVVQLGIVRDVTGETDQSHRCYVSQPGHRQHHHFLWRSAQRVFP